MKFLKRINSQSKRSLTSVVISNRINSELHWLATTILPDSFSDTFPTTTRGWLKKSTVYRDGMLMLTGDINIDMLPPSHHLTKRYQGILDMFELTQIVKRPTRVTRTSKTLTDHFITNNHPQKVTNTGIILCSIVSDHDAIYACVNVRLPRFQPRYKFIRDIKNFKADVSKEDFSTLSLSVISYSDDPDEQLETLNALISERLERH